MAGRESSGFGAADATLFRDRPWVITPATGGGDAAAVEALALACGARPVAMDAVRHDRLVAAISHVPLLTSVVLVEAMAGTAAGTDPDWAAASALAAGGWRDTTRLARGDTAMGAEIAATNAGPIAERAALPRPSRRLARAARGARRPRTRRRSAERLDAARARLEG